MMTIGIICALDCEFALIQKALSHGEAKSAGLYTVCTGEFGGKQIAAALCGIGKVNAAACTQILISEFHADCVINSGVSGALSPDLHIMDIVIATDVMYHDLVSEFLGEGYFPGVKTFRADEQISTLAADICAEQKVPFMRGRIASGDQFVTDSARKAEIIEITQAATTEMEGAAVGHVCYLNRIPFAIIRCVSDGADDNGGMDFDTFAELAAERCSKITLALLERI